MNPTDIVVFALAKKTDHVSALHVITLIWVAANYGVMEQNIFNVVIKSCVFAIMLYYYILTTLGPQVRPYSSKRYMTRWCNWSYSWHPAALILSWTARFLCECPCCTF